MIEMLKEGKSFDTELLNKAIPSAVELSEEAIEQTVGGCGCGYVCSMTGECGCSNGFTACWGPTQCS